MTPPLSSPRPGPRLPRRLFLALGLGAAQAAAGPRNWQTATIQSVEFEPQAPVGQYPGMKKGIRYAFLLENGDEIIAYHVSATVFSGFRTELAAKGDRVKIELKKRVLRVEGKDGKVHKLDVQRTTARPPK
jgi:hypothetical protein